MSFISHFIQSCFLAYSSNIYLIGCRYVTREDVVEVKGQVACEISSADELTLTELMFSGLFQNISVEEMVALLSCFVWQEKLQDAPKPREELGSLFSQLQETARRVANVQLDCKVLSYLFECSPFLFLIFLDEKYKIFSYYILFMLYSTLFKSLLNLNLIIDLLSNRI